MKHGFRLSLLAALAAALLPASSAVPSTNIAVGPIRTVSDGLNLQVAVINQPDGSQGIKFWGDFNSLCDSFGCSFMFSAPFTNNLGPDLSFSYDFDILNNASVVSLAITSSVDGILFSTYDQPDSGAYSGALTVSNGTIALIASSPTNFTVHVPNNSLDFTPTSAAVPEPGSLTLMAGAAALLLVRARSVRK